MRHAARRDANEKPLIVQANLMGWCVFELSLPGFPDLMCVKHGAVRFLEVKTEDGKLTPAQQETFLRLQANGVRVRVVRTPAEVQEALR